MKRAEKIKDIYGKIANKTLSEGCKTNLGIIIGSFHLNNNLYYAMKVDFNTSYYEYIDDNILNAKHQNYIKTGIKYYKYIAPLELLPIEQKELENNKPISFVIYPNTLKIIGHPVMYGDIVDYINKNNLSKIRFDEIATNQVVNTFDDFHDLYEHKRKPIEEQSDECIDYIYNLSKIGT